jgi:serine/threonine-protein kinase
VQNNSEDTAIGSPVGTRIGGRFAVQALLGSGGMADVYRVRDDVGGGELALKRLRRASTAQDQQTRALFEREFHTLAQLSHPCVIRVYDYGVDEVGAYYTMELLEGEDLRKRGRLPWREACLVLRDIASALAVLHSRRWLHRDLSPRNVVCTTDNVAKLIDFGVMAPMGSARALVGTPPLVPPEAMQQQSLDARADLYALGALAYWVLTGRHAYAARNFDELRDRWRSVPRPPDKLVPEVPAALSRLVLALLSLDRGARPASASEVIERLTALIGEPDDGRADVGVAYLATPRLVGRDPLLQFARECLVESLRGNGTALLIEGDAGSGRSRFLDACVLEAKLLGAVVLRGDASDAARGDYGLAAALGDQVLRALPDMAADAARLRRDLLGKLVSGLAESGEAPAGLHVGAAERRHMQTALRDWFLAIARNKRIVIAVDDFDRVDEPSAAWLAALAHKSSRRKLVVVASVQRNAARTAALDILGGASSRLELPPLSEAQSEALLQSLFGDARNLAAVALRVHEVSRGNPRRVMELAEHLVRRGLARYAAGTWTLPEQLGAEELPASIEAALAFGLQHLDDDARELAEALALTDPQALALDAYPLLLDAREPSRTFRALDALVASGILQPEGERYRFVHQRSSDLLAGRVSAERCSELHARLSRAAESAVDPMRLPYHLMHSGQERRAIDVLLAHRADSQLKYSETMIALLEQGIRAAEQLELPLRTAMGLRLWLVVISGPLGRLDVFLRYAPALLHQLERASGLADYRELGDCVPAPERLQRALASAQARHDALPPAQRPLPPLDAVRELGRMCATYGSVAAMAFDLELVEQLPSLAPFAPITAAISVVQMLTDAIVHHQAGRFERARELQAWILARIAEPDRAGLDDLTHARILFGVRYSLAILDAMAGQPSAIERVVPLLDQPGYRSNAWRVHAIYHSMQGDFEEARRAERRAELLMLQDGAGQLFPGTGSYTLSIVQWLADDLEGVKQLMEQMRLMAQRFPGWHVPHQLARSHYLRLKGDARAALELVEPLLPAAPAGRHLASVWVAATYVGLLCELGRAREAAEFGRRFLDDGAASGYSADDSAIVARATAEALALVGQHDEAVRLSDEVLSALEAHGVQGLRMGTWYETRARVALAMGDEAEFRRWAGRCGEVYTRGAYAALTAKYGRLLHAAHSEGMGGRALEQLAGREDDGEREGDDALQATIWSRLGECVDGNERARCALLVLMEQCHVSEGHLYGLIEGRLSHLVSIPDAAAGAELAPMLEQCVQAELRASDTTAIRGPSIHPPAAARASVPPRHRCVVLAVEREGDTVIAAAAALGPAGAGYEPPPAHLLATLAEGLLDHDDVDPMTRLV